MNKEELLSAYANGVRYFENEDFSNEDFCSSLSEPKNFFLNKVVFVNCNFENSELNHAIIDSCKFINCNLKCTSFDEAILLSCLVEECNIERTSFAYSHLINTQFVADYGEIYIASE
jgi:uncharacterized protein YjbI with pentapeptide repeats